MLPDKILGIFYMYGLMIALGILACFGVLFLCSKKKKVEEKFVDFVFYNAIAAIAIGFLAAALFQGLYDYIENPAAGFHPFKGGITFIGGLIGGVVSFLVGYFIFRKKFKSRLVDIINFVPCCILIAHAFGRVGCFFAGCCHGSVTDSIFGVSFPKGTSAANLFPDPNNPNGGSLPVHPTQLYEALFLFALCAVLFLLFWKKNFKHTMSIYLIAYGFFRFGIEFLRADHRGQFLGSISPSQFWSIAMVVAGVGVYFLLEWAYKKRAAELAAEGASAEESSTEKPAVVWTVVEGEENAEETATPTETSAQLNARAEENAESDK